MKLSKGWDLQCVYKRSKISSINLYESGCGSIFTQEFMANHEPEFCMYCGKTINVMEDKGIQ